MRTTLWVGLVIGGWTSVSGGAVEDTTGATAPPRFSFTADMAAYTDNLEYFNEYREGYLHLGARATTRLSYRPVERLSFALGVHLRKAFGEERFLSDARPVFRASYHNGAVTFTIGELQSTGRHGLPDMLLSEQWSVTHPVEEGFQFLYAGEMVRQDLWAVYDSLNTPDHREHLMAGSATFVHAGPVTFMALAYGDHYGGQAFAPEGDPVRENVAGGLGAQFVHTREGMLSEIGGEQIAVVSVATEDRERLGYEHGGGSFTRVWLTVAGLQTSLMVFKGHDFVAWKGNPLYRARDIYYYLETRKRLELAGVAWLEFGARFDFVDIAPADYFDHAENRLWVTIGGALDRPLR